MHRNGSATKMAVATNVTATAIQSVVSASSKPILLDESPRASLAAPKRNVGH